jgi:hypothetical protein
MGWDRSDIEAAVARLVDRGLAAGGRITPVGHDLRESIEQATSAQEASMIQALGDDLDELIALVDPWARAAVARRDQPG